MLTHGSLFSGIGGFELGAKWAGIETLWNCEIDPDCRAILKQHFPDTIQYEDIQVLNNPQYTDILTGGFPCQDISVANTLFIKKHKKYGEKIGIKAKRSGLWYDMYRIICNTKPKYIIIENVPNLVHRGLVEIIKSLAKAGYDTEWCILSASQFGFPQVRKRLFIIAYPKSKRFNNSEYQTIFNQEIMPIRETVNLSDIAEQIERKSDNTYLRDDTTFSFGLDEKKRIKMLGNSVIPKITHYLFECIKNHYSNYYA